MVLLDGRVTRSGSCDAPTAFYNKQMKRFCCCLKCIYGPNAYTTVCPAFVTAVFCVVIAQVIAMEYTRKSGQERNPLQFLRPNSFYLGVVRMLLRLQKASLGSKH